MPKPTVPPKNVNGKDTTDNLENEVSLLCIYVDCINVSFWYACLWIGF